MKLVVANSFVSAYILASAFLLIGIGRVMAQDTIREVAEHEAEQLSLESRIAHYYEESVHHRNEPTIELQLIKQGFSLTTEASTPEQFHQGLNLLASYWYYSGNLDSANYYIKTALPLRESTAELTTTQNVYGKILFQEGKHEQAVQAHIKALTQAERSEDTYNTIIATNDLGNIYRYLGKQEKAKSYYEQSLKLSTEYENDSYIASNLGNLGLVYRALGQNAKALEAYRKSLAIHRKNNEDFSVSIDLMNIGVYYENTGEHERAIEYHIESNEISRRIEDDIGIVLSYNNIAINESKLGNYGRAEAYLDSSLTAAQKIDYKEGYRHIYQSYSENEALKGNFNEAYDYRLEYEKWNDTLINLQHLQAVSELEIKYDTEKQQNQLLVMSEQRLQDKMLLDQKQRSIRYLTFGALGTVLLFTTFFLLLRQRAKSQRQKELLIAITQTQLSEQKRIASDLHDSVGGSLALMKNRLEQLVSSNGGNGSSLEPFVDTLSQTSERIRMISHNIVPSELLKFGLVSAVGTFLEDLESDDFKTFLYVHGMEGPMPEVRAINLFRIVQEAAQNTLKHAGADTFTVNINEHGDYVSLLIEDDGSGFNSAAINEGMGLQNIRNRVALLHGSLEISSTPGIGTTLNIKIPIE